jgi:hypothetical protein
LLDTVSGAVLDNVTFNNVENGIEIIGCKDTYLENVTGTWVNDLAIRVSGSESTTIKGCRLDNVSRALLCTGGSIGINVQDWEIGTSELRAIEYYNCDRCEIVDVSAQHNEYGSLFHPVTNLTIRGVSLSSNTRVLGISYSEGEIADLSIGFGLFDLMDSDLTISGIQFAESYQSIGARFKITGDSNVVIHDLTLPGQEVGLWLRYGANVTVYNSSIMYSLVDDILLSDGSFLHLVNVSFELYSFEDGDERLMISQVLDVTVLDAWDEPLGSIEVTVEGIEEQFTFTRTTGSAGRAIFTPFKVLDVTRSTVEGISGGMEVSAFIGSITDSVVTSVNQSNVVVLRLIDLEPPVMDPDWRAGPFRVETVAIDLEFGWSPWSDNDPSFPLGANFTYSFSNGSRRVIVQGRYVTVSLPVGGFWNVTFKAIDATGNEAEHNFIMEVDWAPQNVTPPVADAGPDEVVRWGNLFNLDGTYSQGDLPVVKANWRLVGLPPEDYELVGRYQTLNALAAGVHEYLFYVEDWMGNNATDVKRVTVIPRRSVVKQVTELDGPLTKDVTIEGTTSGDMEIHRVEYRIDGGAWELAEGTATWSFPITVDDLKPGIHRYEVRAWNGYNNGTLGPVQFLVEEAPEEDNGTNGGTGVWLLLVVVLIMVGLVVAVLILIARRKKG